MAPLVADRHTAVVVSAATAHTAGFEVYQDGDGQWRWRLRATNGQVVAASGEGFAFKANAIRSIAAVRRLAAEADGHVEVEPATQDELPSRPVGGPRRRVSHAP
jgi:uncharacterized protein YegP (UPF0339 family)